MRTIAALVASIAILGAAAPADAQLGKLLRNAKKVLDVVVPGPVPFPFKPFIPDPVEPFIPDPIPDPDSAPVPVPRGVLEAFDVITPGPVPFLFKPFIPDPVRPFIPDPVPDPSNDFVAKGDAVIDSVETTVKFFVSATGGILEGTKEILTRCYTDAEQETDPEIRQAKLEKCKQKETGIIFGMIGMAAGATFGPGGSAAGAAAGCFLGSAIDGTPSCFVGVSVPLAPPPPGPAPEESPSSEPAPDRAPSGTQKPVPSLSPSETSPKTQKMFDDLKEIEGSGKWLQTVLSVALAVDSVGSLPLPGVVATEPGVVAGAMQAIPLVACKQALVRR